jgi:hypothetical protein
MFAVGLAKFDNKRNLNALEHLYGSYNKQPLLPYSPITD